MTILKDPLCEYLQLHTDASKTVVYGSVFKNKWFYGLWSEPMKQYNIVVLELIPIVIAVHMFSETFKNRTVIVHTVNEALVYLIRNQTSKCLITMSLVRK